MNCQTAGETGFERPQDFEIERRKESVGVDADVRLTVRFDIEDRNFHSEPNATAAGFSFFVEHARA